MEQPPAIPPMYPPQAPAKKGISGLAWLGIGCAGLFLLVAGVGVWTVIFVKGKLDEFTANPEKAAAEFVLSKNPALEKVSQDDSKGTMTIRTKDGETMTLSYKDISQGKITVTDKDGNTTQLGSQDLSVVPAWVPKPADLSDGVSLFHIDGAAEVSGQFCGRSAMGAEDVIAFYETQLDFTSSSGGHKEVGGLRVSSKEFSSDKRKIAVVVTQQPGQATQVNVNYSELK